MLAVVLKALLLAAVTSAATVGDLSRDLRPKLAQAAEIYTPGTQAFDNAKTRWAANINPTFEAIVKITSEEDVQATASFPVKLSRDRWADLRRSHTRTRAMFHFSLSTVATVSPRR